MDWLVDVVRWTAIGSVALSLVAVLARFVTTLNAPVGGSGTLAQATFSEALRRGRVIEAGARFAYQFVSAAAWVYYNIFRRLSRPFVIVAQKVWGWYRRLWDKVVYDGKGSFSRTRGGVFLTATLAFLYILPSLLLFIAQLGLFLFTKERETVYLTYSQEIKPDEDVHAIKGCEALPCTDQSSITFRVHATGFNHLWSVLNHGNIFYPDYVAGAVPGGGVHECRILSYGIRIKLLMRQYDVWPELLEVNCSGENAERKR